ncbi:MAG: hypothetical protein HKP48_02960 [Winogradskyella sp.]|uniref:DoxX family protein n=1 Tax=Winogradskyella sp. TaxID=1883156 RepID=UPI00182D2D87|nr:hypothetical protein [Winogradskyella sp.]MBT8243865.1 hypothetical protein [Winogradskyella sp.]NNK22270.1 hypothetical protein [Winogradskyella sp.]
MIKYLRIILIGFYGFAGSYHFINPEFYYPLIPDYLPYAEFINYASGLLEILLAIGVTLPRTRLLAVKGIITLLIFFIPSHVYFITEGGCMSDSLCVPLWIAWVRLIVIHPLLILWAWSIRTTNKL